jgi:CBS domain-containing protein
MDRSIREVLHRKGSYIVSISPRDSVRVAVQRMNEHHTGSVLVCERNSLVGIFTERDVLRRIVEPDRNIDETRVSEVMSRTPITVDPGATVGEGLALMTNHRVRHLPVVRFGRVEGVVSIGDLVWCVTADLRHEVTDLHEYIHGPASHPTL